jgi:hypothetical protein
MQLYFFSEMKTRSREMTANHEEAAGVYLEHEQAYAAAMCPEAGDEQHEALMATYGKMIGNQAEAGGWLHMLAYIRMMDTAYGDESGFDRRDLEASLMGLRPASLALAIP